MSGVTVMAVVVASCSSSSGSGWSGAATTSSAHALALTTSAQPLKLVRPLRPLKQPSAGRGAPHADAILVRFNTADGISLDGAMVGIGTVGVVLAHEPDNDLCRAWPFANHPAKRGLLVFAVDVCCFGRSVCPQGDAAGRAVDDLVAAVGELRQRGVTRVPLVGASMGGSAALSAARRVKPAVDAVVELRGQANPTSHRIPLNRGAVQQFTVPTMFVVANVGRDASVDETRVMYQANKPADERLLLLPGQFDGFRGWMVLHNTSGGFSTTTTEVVAFIAAHTPRPFKQALVSYGTMVLRDCGPGAATQGLDAQMPSKHGPGCVRRRCLRWRWRSWAVATATAEITYQVAGGELVVVEAAGKYAAHGGLIGDRTITSFGKVARGPIDRAEGAEVVSGRPDVQRVRSAWAVRCARCASAVGSGPKTASGTGSSRERARTRSARATGAFAGAAGVLAMVDTGTGRAVSTFSIGNLMLRGPTRSRPGRRRLHRGAGLVVEGRSGGRRGDADRYPACHRGFGRRRDASGHG
jgi:dienelactone hydrolase